MPTQRGTVRQSSPVDSVGDSAVDDDAGAAGIEAGGDEVACGDGGGDVADQGSTVLQARAEEGLLASDHVEERGGARLELGDGVDGAGQHLVFIFFEVFGALALIRFEIAHRLHFRQQ